MSIRISKSMKRNMKWDQLNYIEDIYRYIKLWKTSGLWNTGSTRLSESLSQVRRNISCDFYYVQIQQRR